MDKNEKPKKSVGRKLLLILLGVFLGLVIGFVLLMVLVDTDEEPEPSAAPRYTEAPAPTEGPEPAETPEPTEAPEPSAAPAPGEQPDIVTKAANGETAEDLEKILRELSDEDNLLLDTDDDYVYFSGRNVAFSATDPTEVRDVLAARSGGGAAGTPSVVTGVVDGVGYIAVSDADKVTVYITAGDQTLKAETDRTDGKKTGTDANAAKFAASAASSVVTASKVKEAYARGRDDYDHNQAVYYLSQADCLVFYPAQLTKRTAFEDQSVIFGDARSSASCSVRLEHNPYVDIDELGSLIRNSPNNTVLAWGDDWLTSEYVKDGIVTYSYVGLGKEYMITEELCYPSKYSFVFEELRELMNIRFLEDGKWVNGNRKPKEDPVEHGAPSYGLQECFYSEFDLFLVIPDTLDEQAVDGNCIYFYDNLRNTGVRVELITVPEKDRDDIFAVFPVIAEDGDLTLGEDFVRWHNSSGLYVGAMAGPTAALLRFDGEDAYLCYEAVYSELMCELVEQYYEPQGNDYPDEFLEHQMTELPEEDPEHQPTASPAPTPVPTPAPGYPQPEPKRTPAKAETEKIVRAVEQKVAEKAKADYPAAPAAGADPLEYYTDADFRAVNASLEDFVDAYPSEQEMILDTILKVLAYNGYAEAENKNGDDLMFELADLLLDIDDRLFELDLFGTDFFLPADLFPYVCKLLELDRVPEYRNRPQSAPPAPDWLEEWREYEDFREDGLNWEAVRQYLDQGEPMPDPWDAIYGEAWPEFYTPYDPWAEEPYFPSFTGFPNYPKEPEYPDGPGYPEDPEDPGEWTPGPYFANPVAWPEYGLYFDEGDVLAAQEQLDQGYRHYAELAREAYPESWGGPGLVQYEDMLLCKEPDFSALGQDVGNLAGEYVVSEPEDHEVEYHILIAANGVWAACDPDNGSILDYGILFPDTEGVVWYTVTADGEFMTVWQFDSSYLITGRYGGLDRVEGAWSAEPEGPGAYVSTSIDWPEYGLYFDEEAVLAAEEQVDRDYRYYADLAREANPEEWEEPGLHQFGAMLLREGPDFSSLGQDIGYIDGEYEIAHPEDYGEYRVIISERGVWAVCDPASGSILDYGILIRAINEYDDMWYTVTADGEFMTVWGFDSGYLVTSKYGGIEHLWTEEELWSD